MKVKLSAIIWSTAIVLALCAAFYSVFGLSKLFSGAVIAVIIVTSVLEISKIVVTTYLHDYWKISAKLLKSYLVFALACLMFITSLGVYGFLTSAYQDTIKDFKIKQGEIGKIDVKLVTIKKQIEFLNKSEIDLQKRLESAQNLKSNQDKTVSTIYSSTNTKNTRLLERSIKATDDIFNKTSNQLLEVQTKITMENDSLNFYEMQKLQLETDNQISEVGPLLYISKFFGIEMDSVVNLLVILIVIVFDPLAVALVIAANGMKNKHETIDEKNNFIFNEKNVILNDNYIPKDEVISNTHEVVENVNVENVNVEDNEEIPVVTSVLMEEEQTSMLTPELNKTENIYGEEETRIVNKGKAVSTR
jgi:hypothetical protein